MENYDNWGRIYIGIGGVMAFLEDFDGRSCKMRNWLGLSWVYNSIASNRRSHWGRDVEWICMNKLRVLRNKVVYIVCYLTFQEQVFFEARTKILYKYICNIYVNIYMCKVYAIGWIISCSSNHRNPLFPKTESKRESSRGESDLKWCRQAG